MKNILKKVELWLYISLLALVCLFFNLYDCPLDPNIEVILNLEAEVDSLKSVITDLSDYHTWLKERLLEKIRANK